MSRFSSDNISSFVFLPITLAIFAVLTNESFASSGGNYASTSSQLNTITYLLTLCVTYFVITGNAGKTFAAFAILSVGIDFFTGKVSWGLMIGVAAGIAMMFGAPTVVAAITGTTTFSCGASGY